ncbi:TetR family transcriptional regulator [Nocardiopsis terrae]|uniref:AcrR family transcriptional regulator n=1 Tax=Nocardiopsis terrae TaxID=372655 RepID=A0ABR9HLD2_9ACTN|nr:TetR/AcrR family transcriptional regulator [Nocardiopsis terrae]MBE1459812.1 AcrR family transcriptional regulator [Nocardiopsis terrae]GHC93851.1 TetR family transcriptional regulator [Nocardiopsis terrae]
MTDTCADGRDRRSAVKHEAITEAALRVFLREGYARASVDAIAADAGVSKRTIYNHFDDKRDLFLRIVSQSSATLAADHAVIAARHLREAGDAREALVGFGDEWLSPRGRRADHTALVRLLIGEAAHFPDAARAWSDSGSELVVQDLAAHLRALADRGLLEIEEGGEETAAGHYLALVRTQANSRSFFGALPLPEEERVAMVRSGVDAFLRIHGPGRG